MVLKKAGDHMEPINPANKLIVDEFEKLIEQIKFDIDHAPSKSESMTNHFRLRQIGAALDIIVKYPDEIKSGNQLKGIKGVGKGTMARIDEILRTGKLKEVKIRTKEKQYLAQLDQLEEVIGIGRKTAYDLITRFDIKSIDELKKAYNDGKIDLPDQVITGLKYYGVYKQNIPRDEIDKINKYIETTIKRFNKDMFHTICGSYRRGKPTSNDVDILITNPKIKTKLQLKTQKNELIELVKILKKQKFLLDDLTDKDYEIKYMGFCQLTEGKTKYPVRRIDIRYIAYESYPSALLYFTGSGDFNRKMRLLAQELGYKLSEYGLFKLEDHKEIKIKVTSEKDIFDKLGMEYISPQLRK